MNDMKIEKVHYLEELEEVLGEIGVEKSDICLFGSTSLAVLDVRPNNDIDFIATKEARQSIRQFANDDPDSKIVKGVRVNIKDHIELLLMDRLDTPPYTFGLDDETVIFDNFYHFTVGDYKFLRPELVLSMKGAKRRRKDRKDIKLIEEAGLIKWDCWDWDRVFVVPPWERTFATERGGLQSWYKKSLLKQAVKSYQRNGGILTAEKISRYLRQRISLVAKESSFTPLQMYRSYQRGERLSTINKDIEYHYPFPRLVSRQYDKRGEFDCIQLLTELNKRVDAPLAQEKSYNYSSSYDDIIEVTDNGKIVSGYSRIAELIHEWGDDLPGNALNKTFEVTIRQPDSSLEGEKDIGCSNVKGTTLEKIKNDLLEKSGVAFYAILWPTLQEHFKEAEKQIRSRVNVISRYDVSGDIDIREFAQDVYRIDKRGEVWFRENKIHELGDYEPNIRILALEIPHPNITRDKGQELAQDAYNLKMRLRESFQDLVREYEYSACIHITDNFEHNSHIGHLLLEYDFDKSYTNLKPDPEVDNA